MPVHIQLRRGTAAQWIAANPILAEGEAGVELDTGLVKIGDGINHWIALPYDVAPTGIKLSASTVSTARSDFTFSNSNGVSFGLGTGGSAGVITATVATDYQSSGPYITTAALSQDSSKYAGTNGAITGGSVTLNTGGLSISLPPYLTTAMASNRGSDFVQATAAFAGTNASGTIASNGISVSIAAPGGGGLTNINVSAGALSNNLSAITFSNSNGVSFGLSANSVITATVATNYQSQGAYLTTAALSQDSSQYAGTSTGIAGGSVTLNTVGISISLPAYLTTAALSQDSSNYVGTSTGMTGGSVTLNTSGIAISLPDYLTTAMQSNAATISNIKVSAGTLSTNRSDITFSNSNGISFGLNTNGAITATVETDYQSAGAYLTTAMHSDAATISNINVSAGTTSNNLSAVTFSNSNGVSFGLDGSTLTATVATNYQSQGAYLTTAMASNAVTLSNIRISAGASSSNVSAITFSNSNGVSFGYDGTNITASVATDIAQSNQTLGIYASSNTTLTSSGTLDARSLSVRAIGSLTAGFSSGELLLSAPNALTTAMLSNAVTLSNVNISAGTISRNLSAFTFSDSNGISWGLNTNSVVTATVATNYQSQGAYLTTADLSQNSSNYAGINGAITGGSITVNTSGVSVALPAYLTTAALSGDTSKYVQAWDLTGNTAGTTSSAQGTKLHLSGGNNVTVSGSSNSIVFSVGNYLTTADLSQNSSNYAGINSGATNCSVTVNTSGVSVNVPNASNQTVGLYASSNTYLTSSGTVDARSMSFRGDKSITVGISSGEVLFSVGAYLTTAALSANTSNYAGINGAITGGSITVNTSGVSVNLPAYLTTAALSGDTSKYAGINSGATNCSVTVNTSGVSVNLPAYLTTADLSANSSNYVAAWDILGNNTAGTTSSAQGTKLHFSAANSLTLSGSSNTIIFSVGAYLTTAALSGDTSKYAGINSGATNCSVTVNTSGVSVNLPAYLTTAALSGDTSKYAGINSGATNCSVTVNTSGVSVNLPAYLTTAALSGDSSLYAQSWSLVGANTAGTTTQNIGSKLNLSGGQGITLSGNASTIVFSVGSYITTAALSGDTSKYAGINSGATNCSVTVNTSGVSVNLPAYLTTAALSQNTSNYAGINAAITGGSITVNTSGVSVNVPLPVTVSMWPDVLPASTAVSTYYSGSTSQGGGGGSTVSGYTFSLYAVPIPLPAAVAFSELRIGVSNARSTAGTGSVTHLYSLGFYTNNASTLSLVKGYYGGLVFSQNSITAQTFSVFTFSTAGNTAGGVGGFAGISMASVYSSNGNISSNSQMDNTASPIKFLRVDNGAATTLTGNQYYCVIGHCSVSSSSNVYSALGLIQSNAISSLAVPDLGRENSTQTSNYLGAWGAISTTFTSASNTATFFALPNAIVISNMSLSSSAWQRFHFPVMRNHS